MGLKNLFEKMEPAFLPGGKYSKLYPIFMRINSMQREEPYQGLTCAGWLRRRGLLSFLGGWFTGGAWLSSARVVRCWVKSRNERNPYH